MLKKLYYYSCLLFNILNISRHECIVGKNTIINGLIQISGLHNSVTIGDNCTINSNGWLVPIGYYPKTIFWTFGKGKISIGNNCGITNSAFCSASSINIGNYVLIGGGCKFYDTDFHSLDYEKRIDFMHDNDRRAKPIIVKDGAFIGAGTIILKGVTVGCKSIIGAGSVVTHNIPDGEIWAGNPAKYIKGI